MEILQKRLEKQRRNLRDQMTFWRRGFEGVPWAGVLRVNRVFLKKKDILSRRNSITEGGSTMAVQDLQVIQVDRLYVPWKQEL